jgi:hypothetical protein
MTLNKLIFQRHKMCRKTTAVDVNVVFTVCVVTVVDFVVDADVVVGVVDIMIVVVVDVVVDVVVVVVHVPVDPCFVSNPLFVKNC